MATIAEALAVALEQHRAGNLAYAEQVYRQILSADADQVDALCYLGVACLDTDRLQEAVDHYRHALRLRPNHAASHSDLGIGLARLGKTEEAAAAFREAIRLQPDHAEAHNNLGIVLDQMGRTAEARACYEQALRLRPNYAAARDNQALLQGWPAPGGQTAETLNDHGLALAAKGDLQGAIAAYQQALALQPDYVIALNNLGLALQGSGRLGDAVATLRRATSLAPHMAEVYNNLGVALKEQHGLDEARGCFEQALRLKPGYADPLSNLGAVCHDQGHVDEAIRWYQQALQARPDHVDAYNNLGGVYFEEGQLEEALSYYRYALRLDPSSAKAYGNLATTLQALGRVDEGIEAYDQAIRLAPDDAATHVHRALTLLRQGKFEQAWPGYELRWDMKIFNRAEHPQPRWHGSALDGQILLLYAEQGLGDTLQFVRYAPQVKARGGQVVVECQPGVLPLLVGCRGVDRLVVQRAAPPDVNLQAPLLSLPALFKTTLASIPADVPYLFTDAALVRHWQEELRGWTGFRIGISWQGSATHKGDRQRSVALVRFAELSRLPGVELLSLQKEAGAEQLTAETAVIDLGSRLETFAGTAAVMRNLDLVITVDTAVAHCAGALGVPVWVALPFAPDWRWLLHREESPWYPSMRLFRQAERGGWDEVFRRIARELESLLAATVQRGRPWPR